MDIIVQQDVHMDLPIQEVAQDINLFYGGAKELHHTTTGTMGIRTQPKGPHEQDVAGGERVVQLPPSTREGKTFLLRWSNF